MNVSIFKKCIFLFLLSMAFNAHSQTFEDEVTNKSCDCITAKISSEGQISKEEIQNCVSKSGDEVLKSKDPKEVKKITKNLQQFVERLRIIYKNVSNKCLPKEENSK